MIRFVVSPAGEVTPDLAERLPGRGLWVRADRRLLETAVAKRLFAKAARRAVTVPADLIERLDSLLSRRCLERIGIARRAGQAVAGHEKAAAWLEQDKAGLVLRAADAGAGTSAVGRDKSFPCVLSAEEMGRVFERSRAVTVALAGGPLATQLRTDLERLAGLRAGPSNEMSPKRQNSTTVGTTEAQG